MLLSCHVRISEWITLYTFTECQGTPCLKQAPYLKFKWQQPDLNPQPLSSKTNTQQFSQTGQMIELCSNYLSIWCIWLYVVIMLRRSFKVNPHSLVCLNFKELLAWNRCHIKCLSDSNMIWTHNCLVCKRTLNDLAKQVNWLICVVSTYLYVSFDWMLLSCHIQVWD